MRYESLSKAELKRLRIGISHEAGFTLWCKETKKIGSRNKLCEHWIMDGSCLKEDSQIQLCNSDIWDIVIKYDKKSNCLKIVKRVK